MGRKWAWCVEWVVVPARREKGYVTRVRWWPVVVRISLENPMWCSMRGQRPLFGNRESAEKWIEKRTKGGRYSEMFELSASGVKIGDME